MIYKTALSALAFTLAAGVAQATTFSFGATTDLGTITGPSGSSDFYGYVDGTGALTGTFNANIDLSLATAYMFVYEDAGSLSLGMVFTGSNVADPRQTCRSREDRDLCRTTFEGNISGLDGASDVVVKDDPINTFGDEDGNGDGANGFFSLRAFTGTTDGFIASGIIEGQDVIFDVTEYANFEQSFWISGSEDDLKLTSLDFSNGGILSSPAGDPSSTSPVPLPASMAFLLSAFGIAGGVSMRKKKAQA